ncbi:hypothetical protein [Pedobacter agri]|uniref:Uncharacterized protein n=1 Tax=Pedobacter agri TaxID=454586 RepID=A0A9X3DF11_9SPHI|nr:hypothetical protein [Pedobacter agri]MCX3266588.1 hypothetical protein [Pedobacter agri]
MDLDQLRTKACRTLALINLIERSNDKCKEILKCSYYPIYGKPNEQSEMVEFQNRVTQRLVNNLKRTTT